MELRRQQYVVLRDPIRALPTVNQWSEAARSLDEDLVVGPLGTIVPFERDDNAWEWIDPKLDAARELVWRPFEQLLPGEFDDT